MSWGVLSGGQPQAFGTEAEDGNGGFGQGDGLHGDSLLAV
jgi:hypothetical protein